MNGIDLTASNSPLWSLAGIAIVAIAILATRKLWWGGNITQVQSSGRHSTSMQFNNTAKGVTRNVDLALRDSRNMLSTVPN